MSIPETAVEGRQQSDQATVATSKSAKQAKVKPLPKGRPPGSKNKPKDNPKPRKPYVSTKRIKCAVKENLLDRLRREVTEQALAVIPCEQFEGWLAAYATNEGNDYVRKDQHKHTYNSTHHRVVTYGCNHKEIRRLPRTDKGHGDRTNTDEYDSKNEDGNDEDDDDDEECEYETLGCEAILDIYYFYESSVYQIVQLGEHEHEPTNMPQLLFGPIPGIGVEYRP